MPDFSTLSRSPSGLNVAIPYCPSTGALIEPLRRHWFEPNGEGRREATRLLQELDAAVASLQVLLTRSAEISESLGQVPPNSLDQTVALIVATAALARAPATAKDYVASLFDRAENRRLPEALAAGKDWTLAHRAAEPAFAD